VSDSLEALFKRMYMLREKCCESHDYLSDLFAVIDEIEDRLDEIKIDVLEGLENGEGGSGDG